MTQSYWFHQRSPDAADVDVELVDVEVQLIESAVRVATLVSMLLRDNRYENGDHKERHRKA